VRRLQGSLDVPRHHLGSTCAFRPEPALLLRVGGTTARHSRRAGNRPRPPWAHGERTSRGELLKVVQRALGAHQHRGDDDHAHLTGGAPEERGRPRAMRTACKRAVVTYRQVNPQSPSDSAAGQSPQSSTAPQITS
jgi:hypothetical protein